MKVLYGVQGTGNGHITRARALAPALKEAGIEVTYLFSGRSVDQYFSMEPFGDYLTFPGLTFHGDEGAVSIPQTIMKNNPLHAIGDAWRLDLGSYDLVISDFEPVSAWAAKFSRVRSIGIAHQYSFGYPLPKQVRAPLVGFATRTFAPVDIPVGVHWDAFGAPLLPPLIDAPNFFPASGDFILVYMPWIRLELLEAWLTKFPETKFVIYSDVKERGIRGHIEVRPLDRLGFQQALADCGGVFTNAGFGLLSEALQYGKSICSLPQVGQPEQIANAAAIEFLGWGVMMHEFSSREFARWLDERSGVVKAWPDVATELAAWLSGGAGEPVQDLSDRLWEKFRE